MTEDHVSLFIERLDLPDDDQRRDDFLEDLEVAVEAVLADYGLDADYLSTFGGHTYTSIKADCPLCGDRLKLIEPTLDTSNGALATASCECGWRGDAVYRLIDLRETQADPSDNALTTDDRSIADVLDETSSVRMYDIQPTYAPY